MSSRAEALVIAVANQKGGVGKTATSVNLAGEFARKGMRVLLVDSDPQGNATTCLGINKRSIETTVYDMLMGHVMPHDAVLDARRAQLSVIAADENLAGAMVELVEASRREYRLADALRELAPEYDIVLIDCPPSLGLLTLNALCAADYVFIPLQCEFLALEGLAQLKGTIDRVRDTLNRQLAILGVVMTMYDGRTNLAQQVVQEVRRYFPQQICNTLIPRSVRASEAPSYGQLLYEYDPASRVTQAYTALADELLARIKKRSSIPAVA